MIKDMSVCHDSLFLKVSFFIKSVRVSQNVTFPPLLPRGKYSVNLNIYHEMLSHGIRVSVTMEPAWFDFSVKCKQSNNSSLNIMFIFLCI